MSVPSYSVDLRDLLEAGCHFGHQARRWNPKMKKYIFTNRDGIHIFDLAQTAQQLVLAQEFVRDWVASGKDIIFVGTKRQAAAIVKEEAQAVGAPYINVRWLGGTLTNWEQMYRRIQKLRTMKLEKERGDWKQYTKKERVLMDKEIEKLERFLGGIQEFRERPEALFIVDIEREQTAIKEAILTEVPVVGLVDTNGDPTSISMPIPVNDDAVRSIKLMVSRIAQAYADGKALRGKAPAQPVAPEGTIPTQSKAVVPVDTTKKAVVKVDTTPKAVVKVEKKPSAIEKVSPKTDPKKVVKPKESKTEAKKSVDKKVSTSKSTAKKAPVKKAVVAKVTKAKPKATKAVKADKPSAKATAKKNTK